MPGKPVLIQTSGLEKKGLTSSGAMTAMRARRAVRALRTKIVMQLTTCVIKETL
jgi:hypothetical protein